MGNNTYRDELDAALQQSDALRQENEALRKENEALRAGMPLPPPRPVSTPNRAAPAVLAVAGVLVAVGAGAGFFLVRAAPPRPVPVAAARSVDSSDAYQSANTVLTNLTPSLAQCGTGLHHAVTVTTTFASSGEVTNVQVLPPAEGTPLADCVTRVIRGARTTSWVGNPVVVTRAFIL